MGRVSQDALSCVEYMWRMLLLAQITPTAGVGECTNCRTGVMPTLRLKQYPSCEDKKPLKQARDEVGDIDINLIQGL